MNFKRVMSKTAAIFAVVFVFAACDDEFSNIGGDVIENPSDLEVKEVDVVAYNKKLNAVQTNNLSNSLLGVYNHPVYGQSTASILSQISLSTKNPTFGEAPELDSVVMTIPYFSTKEELDEDGNLEYSLDSVYGNEPIKITVQESNYFLNDLDPDLDFKNSKYYSNQQDLFEQNLVGEVIYESASFTPSEKAIISYEKNEDGVEDTIVGAPALRLKLPTTFFKEKIIDKEGSNVLSNNNNFKNYLRGLFIKAEATGQGGSMMLFENLANNAAIKLYYTSEVIGENEDGDEETVRQKRDYTLNFGQNIVNTFEGEYPGDILQAINDSNEEVGAENLFLKGGEGSMAVIELFDSETQIEELKENNWLINEANLVFHVNRDFVNSVNENNRLYLYDLTNGALLADYSFARNYVGDYIAAEPGKSLVSFSAPIAGDEESGSYSYTINITQHVTNIIENEEEDNVKLGLVIVDNINNVAVQNNEGSIAPIHASVKDDAEVVETMPAETILTPEGTVLYGNLTSDEEKRLKLRIYYTETK